VHHKFAVLVTAMTALLVILYGCFYYTTTIPVVGVADVTSITFAPPEPPAQKPYDLSKRITGKSVRILSDGRIASGSVIGKYLVLTVEHVVKKQEFVLVNVGKRNRVWVTARVVGRMLAFPENIVLLRILGNRGFNDSDCFSLTTKNKTADVMVTPSGVFKMNPGSVAPGDSGSAVLNSDGDLVGLVTGYKIKNRGSVVSYIVQPYELFRGKSRKSSNAKSD